MAAECGRALHTAVAGILVGGIVVAAVLTGCSTTSGDRSASGRRGTTAGEEASMPGRADPARPRGAFYLDDGPGDRDLAELAALAAQPEPLPFAEPLHPRANQPYRVLGNDYRPMTRREPFRQRGVASWYGRKFHGQPTSIGERYDMYGLTAAHPTLPIPSFVRVTHLGNGRSVVVRVNDRGPFLHNRAIDLSYLAAHKLGYAEQGSAEVEVELLDPSRPPDTYAASRSAAFAAAPPPAVMAHATAAPATVAPATVAPPTVAPATVAPASAAPADAPVTVAPVTLATVAVNPLAVVSASAPLSSASPTSAPHFLQLGAFSARSNAEAASMQLRRQLEWLQVPIEVEPHGNLFRVKAGPYPVRELAAQAGVEVASRTGLRPLLLQRPTD